ncbi:MAG TPA: MFS transporter [Acidimicrobiia bacterium]|jgi:MFS family permease
MTTTTAALEQEPVRDNYRWIALSNTTLGVFMASLDSSIVLISMPAIFRGIGLDPLEPANIGYLLWMLMGYLVVTAVLVVTFGRLGDMYGRVRMYNAGFAVFSGASLALSLCPWTGAHGAMWLIIWRVVQGVGGALLTANSAAILTDAFPATQRGFAIGVAVIAGMAGAFIGLVVGGVLADVDWRAVFWVNVPIGVFGTVWAYLKLREIGTVKKASIDWWGNVTFAAGLVMVLIGLTYGLLPHGANSMGWTGPWVLLELVGGIVLLGIFAVIETKVADPMFNLKLFRIRAFTAGNIAGFLGAIGRGGLQFMLIIWLQGIWLPERGYSFERTPLWAGIFMLPLTGGFLIAGPICGWLSDKYGARWFATSGMLLTALSFGLLMLLPANFSYPAFFALLLLNGIGNGMFAAPNMTGIMNSAPPNERGAASGMRATFQNTGMVLSIGVFFSLMIVGLTSTLPHTMAAGLQANGVDATTAAHIAALPAVGSLFAAFLGYNPMAKLLGAPAAGHTHSVLSTLPHAQAAHLTGTKFFPELISGPFKHGLVIAFTASLIMCVIAAAASWMRGERYVYGEAEGDLDGQLPDVVPFGDEAVDSAIATPIGSEADAATSTPSHLEESRP